MNAVELINKKFKNETHTKAELQFLIDGFLDGSIKDYQMSAWLMAVRFNDLSDQELADLTQIMMYSGDVLDLSDVPGIKVDKHSTGGVGDKITLILAPVLAACGLVVAKMSGRGLGHTGGTIDKLEAIPGYNVEIREEQFKNQLRKYGLAVVGQNPHLVPADKAMYALRDVTATVESIPLIASSIMSKKLATGSDAILLDVKVGSGAFMKTIEQAEDLAKRMIAIGKLLNKKVRVEITNMQRPLGLSIGNKNEVLEALHTLQGKGVADILTIVYGSAGQLLQMAGKVDSVADGISLAQSKIINGEALAKFEEMVIAQGGDYNALLQNEYWSPKHKVEIKADKLGYFVVHDALAFGLFAVDLGAGRHTKESEIDFEAGIQFNKQTNNQVQSGDLLFTLYSSKPIDAKLVDKLKDAWSIEDRSVPNTLILKSIQ